VVAKNHAREWKTWRLAKLMSQAKLAKAMGVTTRTVWNVESRIVTPSYTSQARFKELVERHRRNSGA
jgi:transcriptional regulator with XRE-family HTH domain